MREGEKVMVAITSNGMPEHVLGVITERVVRSDGTRTFRVRLGSGKTVHVDKSSLSVLERAPSSEEGELASTDNEAFEESDMELEMPVQTMSASEETRVSESDVMRHERGRARVSHSPESPAAESSASKRARKQQVVVSINSDDEEQSQNVNQTNMPAATTTTTTTTKVMPMTSSGSSIQAKTNSGASSEVLAFLGKMEAFSLPQGVAGAVAQLLLDQNRPLGMTNIVHPLKETYTRTQIEKALATLVTKNIVSTIEDGAKLFWINQTMVEKTLSSASASPQQVEAWTSTLSSEVQARESDRLVMEAKVKGLILAPNDDELQVRIKVETGHILQLEKRLAEIRAIEAAAQKQGKDAAAVNAETEAEARHRLEFYKRQTKDRKRITMDFLDTVCDAKGLRGAARKDLIETIGLEMD